MTNYYVVLVSRSHAFLLERRMKMEGVACELSYLPKDIMIDLCNMGIKFPERELVKAVGIIKRSGLLGVKVYREVLNADGCGYYEVMI